MEVRWVCAETFVISTERVYNIESGWEVVVVVVVLSWSRHCVYQPAHPVKSECT
jgi:hypothetical protein